LYAGNNKYSVALCAVFIIIGVLLYQNHFLLWAKISAGLALLAFGTRRLRWIDPTRAVVKVAFLSVPAVFHPFSPSGQ
jgi:hypothetical protein